MGFELYPHQIEALDKLRSGAILYGDVGSGKTLTSLAYYIKAFPKRKLYVITTAKKRDSGDWEEEAAMLGIQDIVVDSWNNIKNYIQVTEAFFIFDEQRVVGYQAWSKTFIKIARFNNTNKAELSYSNFTELITLIQDAGFIYTADSLPAHIAQLIATPHSIVYSFNGVNRFCTPFALDSKSYIVIHD